MKCLLVISKIFIIINSSLGLFINFSSPSLMQLRKKPSNLIMYNNNPNNLKNYHNNSKNKSVIYKMNYNNDDLENLMDEYDKTLNLLIIYILFLIYIGLNI